MSESNRDRFRPPGIENAPPLALKTPPPRPKSIDPEPPVPLPAELKPRKPLKYRVPKASWVTLGVMILALIGFFTVGHFAWGWGWGHLRRLPEKLGIYIDFDVNVGKEKVRLGAPTYKPLDMGDAVLIDLEITPRSAKVTIDGDDLPSNPVRLGRGDARHGLVVAADGYETAALEIVADKPKTVKIKLRRLKER